MVSAWFLYLEIRIASVENVVIKSFFGRFKDAWRCRFQYRKKDDLKTVVDEASYYFNYIRPICKPKRKPPVQYRMNWQFDSFCVY